MPGLLQHGFLQAAARLPAKTAVVAGAERVSYAGLLGRVRVLVGVLREAGVQPGDRVLLFLESSVEFAVAVHATLCLGATFVPVSALTKAAKLAFLVQDTGATALCAHAHLQAEWAAALALAEGNSIKVCLVAGGRPEPGDARVRPWPQAEGGPELPEPLVGGQDLAALIYTSGTTGKPKGVMLTHAGMLAAWRAVQAYIHLREDDVIGLVLPPAFSYGLYYLLMGLGLGATLVLERSFAFPVKVLERLAAERASVFPGVPTLFTAILGLKNLASYNLDSLRIVTNAAAALPVTHLEQLCRAWPNMAFYSMYGMTECKRISYLPPQDLLRKPGSVGKGMPFQQHWLVDEQGRRLADGSVGELVVCGPHLMKGYWQRPEETAQRLRHDPATGQTVLFTGDLFRSDDEGYLYFVSRLDDIIKTRGEKVAPKEVEHVICELQGVQDAAVVGVPDESLGQAVKAYVKLRDGAQLTPREVIRHCLARLESFMAPKEVVFVDELPRTDSGKVRRVDLR